MNILHISPYYPSLYAKHAGGVCMGHEIITLSKKHNVYVLCFGDKKKQDEEKLSVGLNAKKVECYQIDSRIKNVLLNPLMANQFAVRKSQQFFKAIIRFIEEYHIDAVHIEYAVMGQYIKTIKQRFPSIICNLILHDVTYQSYIRQISAAKNPIKKLYYTWQTALIKKAEKEYVSLADNVLVFSEKDKLLVEKLYGKINVFSINTYFDVEEALAKGRERAYENLEKSVCFFGQMGRIENDKAAIRLVKIIDTYQISTKLYVIGNNPSSELQAMQSERCVVTGFVDNPDLIMEKCQLAVFPLMVGAGIKIKVLHCMALGIPIITTAIGAEGIDEQGDIISLAETDEEIAKKITKYLDDLKWQKATGLKGINLIEKGFRWEKTEKVFDLLYTK